MITLEAYFAGKPHGPEHEALAAELLEKVNMLIDEAVDAKAFSISVCPNTGSEISGSKGGSGDGGFRLQTATTGTKTSSHKEAKAVDVYDPKGDLDAWLDDFEHGNGDNTKLEEYDLFRESPEDTPGWCHLSTRAPASKRRTFKP